MVGEERADTRRGVNACACMWFTPKKGICHAAASPFAVSRPVEREERMPGPRVAVMKVGLSFWVVVPLARRMGMVETGEESGCR